MPAQPLLQHVLWRFGFGPEVNSWPEWQRLPQKDWWPTLKKKSLETPLVHFDVADSAIKGLLMGLGETSQLDRKDLDKNEKKVIREKSKDNLKTLNALWVDEMVQSPAQLREKMAFFWHGHFASRNFNILYQQQLLEIVRTHALGNFKTLLTAVSKSAAMLAFLNNQQNKKSHPNENFAREVMELFTLGRGHYTERDVQEAARAFTGWAFRLDGTFAFRRRDHDTDSKTVLGQTGNFDGDQVLDMLLEQRQTAYFITRKIYRFLVNEQSIPNDRIQQLGDIFYNSGYEIMVLLEAIATAPWFMEPANRGVKIKSPIELWVGLRRTIPLQLDHADGQMLLQRALGQVLFYPPNVAGWPGGKTWIDVSSLMLRLRLPHIVANNADLDLSPKDDDDVMMGQKGANRLTKRMALTADLEPVSRLFRNTQGLDIPSTLAGFLWQVPNAQPSEKVLFKHTDHSTREKQIQTSLLQLMATPEYQLC